MVVHMCMRALGALPDARYMTEAEHKAQLAKERDEDKLYESVEKVQES